MKLIQRISQDPFQVHNLLLDDGSQVSLQLYYRTQQRGWFLTELVWKDQTIRGVRISNQPNILRPWKNILTFGLACFTQGNREPTQIEDFASGASKLYILTPAEVREFEDSLSEK